ncbi:cytochrome P450 [Streptomyces sp. B29(2018)]|uniref:cytochrome P450 n=1 Tax=Streptomyces sp. B29(2018) TaxID=2485016 RepID=UPI000FD69CBF|nr:cytochrome P450 [Streptomyces sp. B29(2018)]
MTGHFHPDVRRCPVGAHAVTTQPAPTPIFGPEFDANSHKIYDQLRAQGPIATVEISPGVYGYLAVTYPAALELLRNTPRRFAKDPRGNWHALVNGQVPPDSPARAMMQPRDNALWLDGEEHRRLRTAIIQALSSIDTYNLVDVVTRVSDQLIDAFAHVGEADLVPQYADPLPMLTIIELFDAPAHLGQRIIHEVTRLFAAGPDAAEANAALEAACLQLVHLKRQQPGPDVVSHLINTGLHDGELAQTLLLLFGAAAPPTAKHIARGTQRYLTDESFAGDVHTGVRPVADALEEVHWDDPAVANYSPLYARGDQLVQGVPVQAGYPILVSFAGANSDPAVSVSAEQRIGNRGHLAFSAGAHACPAPDLARIICETAVEHLLDRLTGMSLTIGPGEIPNIPGTFLAGPASLPVRFKSHNDRPEGL